MLTLIIIIVIIIIVLILTISRNQVFTKVYIIKETKSIGNLYIKLIEMKQLPF